MRALLALMLALGACDKEPTRPSKGPADFSQPDRTAATGTGEGAGATHHRDDGRALAADLSQHAPESIAPRAIAEMTGRTVVAVKAPRSRQLTRTRP